VHCPDLLKSHAPSQSHLDFLSAIGVSFPIRNKAKSINTNIVNYQFETGKIKQEMFMMEFDLYQMIEDAMLVQQIIPVDYEINTKSIIFKINVSPLRVKTSHVGGVPREDGLL
jgi:hypothetical protein